MRLRYVDSVKAMMPVQDGHGDDDINEKGSQCMGKDSEAIAHKSKG
jgi:hypothetical protein